MPLIYEELLRLAYRQLRREREGHTLQPTALVHETYLRLVDQSQVDSRNRVQFFGIAANLMRQILVNHAERRQAAKRGGDNRVAFEEAANLVEPQQVDLIELDRALDKLARLDPRQSRIVELRFFGGLSEEEVAEFLDISKSTVKREWQSARAALYYELKPRAVE